jgi:diguanylate cyclase (GGDEF)-like protein
VAIATSNAVSGPHYRAATHARGERSRAVLFQLTGASPGAVFSIDQAGIRIGRGDRADVVLDDASASWEHAALSVNDGRVYVEDLRSLNGTFINDQRVERDALLNDGDYLRIGGGSTVFKFSMMDDFEEGVLRALFELTLRDPLTRLHNGRYFEERLRGELGFAERHASSVSLLLIDVDRLKPINAQFGHQVGDAVLKLVASSIQKMMCPVLARLGSNKFALMIRAISYRNLEILCERVCRRVAALSLEPTVRGLLVTVSVGGTSLASEEHGSSVEGLLARAAEALHEAKVGGGNRFSLARSLEHTG